MSRYRLVPAPLAPLVFFLSLGCAKLGLTGPEADRLGLDVLESTDGVDFAAPAGLDANLAFAPLPARTIGDRPFSVAALVSSRSAQPITVTSLTPSRCTTNAAGTEVRVVDVGVGDAGCVLRASQPSDADYGASETTGQLDVNVQINPVTGSTAGQVANEVSWRSKVAQFNVAINTVWMSGGVTLFDAARVDPGTVSITKSCAGSVALAPVEVLRDATGRPLAPLIDSNGDWFRDVVPYFSKSSFFDAQDVNVTCTITLEAKLKTIAGDPKRDGRLIRGVQTIRLTP